ncbi:glycosyltransferase [Acinetobacter baumannii]|uniref:glycosyltransferase n=1 Tax=Acinetobacter baumannii TaxID=470 RepID=UPI00396F6E79
MKTIIFLIMSLIVGIYFIINLRKKPSSKLNSVDAIVPAYNEEPCLEESLKSLFANPYINKVICVNDGSSDGTENLLNRMVLEWPDKLIAVNQSNTGKGGALMNGLNYATMSQVFLTDADTYVPPDKNGLGYMLAEIENGADAVGGIPSSNLNQASLLPHIRATVKMPMIIMKRTFQQWLGGAPFIISGSCGMFKTKVLKENPFSDRTKVEDLDLTWTLVSRGYKIRQANRCVVYPQECNTLSDEWKRWRRWIAGYAICMKLHKSLLLTRYGIASILPMFLVIISSLYIYSNYFIQENITLSSIPNFLFILFPALWLIIVSIIGLFSAIYHKSWKLIFLAPFAIFYVLLAYLIWAIYGTKAFFTGKEPVRDKPTRYKNVVE